MRSAVRLFLGLFVVFAVAGCDSSDPYEAAAKKMVANVKQFASIMQNVKTASDAEAAAAKLEALARDFEAISADVKKQPKMTDAQRTKVKKVFDDAQADMEKMKSPDNMPEDPEVGLKLAPAAMKAAMAMTDVAVQFESQGMPSK